ncbi:hypothetical protein HYPSUDRAFT_201545 [Hypholoma sublateritium FD-334 SS-4]|uniref:Uncharacterized protein n=1 Tax=Hypholoma sublateritium (strain FD-334 SS-4) TaxID=945553 RepID=A0A0D2NWV5_HYPSF|nr:hypothetical protein HYPSUDRAFT_201545 [Hypholoma sublateritium FD-334 SS-4]
MCRLQVHWQQRVVLKGSQGGIWRLGKAACALCDAQTARTTRLVSLMQGAAAYTPRAASAGGNEKRQAYRNNARAKAGMLGLCSAWQRKLQLSPRRPDWLMEAHRSAKHLVDDRRRLCATPPEAAEAKWFWRNTAELAGQKAASTHLFFSQCNPFALLCLQLAAAGHVRIFAGRSKLALGSAYPLQHRTSEKNLRLPLLNEVTPVAVTSIPGRGWCTVEARPCARVELSEQ